MFAPLLFLCQILALAALAAPPCSLNGAENADGSCSCYGPWIGTDCSFLSIGPTPAASGYGLVPALRSAWGGNVLVDAAGVYHLYVAEMAENCSLVDWEVSSFVTHATAATPLGPFNKQGPSIGVWSHNPQVMRLADGTFAIFHIGSGEGGHPPNCSWGSDATGSALAVAPPAARGGGSTVHVSQTLDGPWTPLLNSSIPSCNNPAPLLHPNGTLYLVCDSIAVFSAPGLDGPWQRVATLGPVPHDAPVGGYEDAFIWLDPRGNWHALFHVWSTEILPNCIYTNVSAHAFSRDGLDWFFSPIQPYNSTVALDDGTTFITPTRERPKLFFGADGEPAYLYNGAVRDIELCPPHWCSRCKQLSNHTFNLVVPLISQGSQGGESQRLG
jgi:hypothetical protein